MLEPIPAARPEVALNFRPALGGHHVAKALRLIAVVGVCGWLPAACGAPEKVGGENWAGPASTPATSEYTPPRAVEREVEGHVALACLQAPEGRLLNCRITYESPQGYGFGASALRASSNMIVRSHAVPVGEITVVPVNFCPRAGMTGCERWTPSVEMGWGGRRRLAPSPRP